MKGTSFNVIVKENRDDNLDLKETRSIPEQGCSTLLAEI
jgi:hypothetical protein